MPIYAVLRPSVWNPPFVVEPNLQQCYRPGARYSLAMPQGGIWSFPVSGGPAGAANSLMFAYPLPVRSPVTMTALTLLVGSGVAGVSGRLALYGGDVLSGKAKLIQETVGIADMGVIGTTEIVLSFATPVQATEGLYWAVSMFNGAAKPLCLAGSSSLLGEWCQVIGAAGTNTFNNATSILGQISRVTGGPVDFGQPFPDQFGPPTLGMSTPPTPIIAWVAG